MSTNSNSNSKLPNSNSNSNSRQAPLIRRQGACLGFREGACLGFRLGFPSCLGFRVGFLCRGLGFRAIEVWVDTGFTGDLVLPQTTIDELNLDHSGSVDAILADGSQIELKTYTCFVDWFGEARRLEVVANDGDYPLLGVGLILGLELRVNYRTMELALNPP